MVLIFSICELGGWGDAEKMVAGGGFILRMSKKNAFWVLFSGRGRKGKLFRCCWLKKKK